MAEKRGVMGGSFNPVHLGHLSICQQVAERLGLSKVILMPAWVPPHKVGIEMAPAEDRLAMCRLAIKSLRGLEVSDLEIRRGGISYTIDTARELKQLWGPDVDLCFIIGSDSLADLPTWKDVRELLGIARFATADRQTAPMTQAVWDKVREELGDELTDRLIADVVPVQRVDVSSTQIRDLVRKNERLRSLTRIDVEVYIRRKGLYGAVEFGKGRPYRRKPQPPK